MPLTKSSIIAAALGVAAVGAQAQTAEQLKDALAQAQAAAARAQAAAQQAQAALEQALAAAEQAKRNQQVAATPPAAPVPAASGSGLTIASGPNSATLYGLIDITYVSQSNADKASHSVFGPRVAWFSGNRWGLTGQRLLGGQGDLKGIFRLESEFESQTGNMDTPGVLFNRDAWVGLESASLGKLTFGRQNALARDPAASAVYGDPYGSPRASTEEGGYTNNNDFKQLIFYAGSATGTRVNNGVVWKKDFGGLVAGAQYQFGGVPGSFSQGTTETGSLAYNGNGYTVAGFATRADIGGLKHTSYSAGGNVAVLPIVRLYGGYFHYTADQAAGLGSRTDTAWTMSTKIAPSKVYDFELGYQTMRAKNAGLTGSGYVQNAFSDTTGIKAVATGNRNTLYASAFYHVDAAMEFYVAADRLKTTGTYLAAQANGARSQNEVGLGMRYKF
ncbi:MAG: porin [Ramlibacter sp.]